MRFTERYALQGISEWMDCYINYKHLKLAVKLIHQCVSQIQQIQYSLRDQNKRQAAQNQSISIAKRHLQRFGLLGIKTHQLFCQELHKQVGLFLSFVQHKYKQITAKFDKSKLFYLNVVKKKYKVRKKLLTIYTQYIFVQAYFLRLMLDSNIEAERRIIEKHIFYSEGLYQTPQRQIQTKFSTSKCNGLFREIQNFYLCCVSHNRKENARNRLKKLAEPKINQYGWLFFGGIQTGIFIAAGLYLGIILEHRNQKFQYNPTFNRDFSVWRGLIFILFYIWSLGFDIYCFQKYNISHRIILQNHQTEYPTSSKIIQYASLFSLLFITLFTLYSFGIVSYLQFGTFAPQYLALILWSIFGIFLINPIPIFFYYSRKYMFKLFFKMVGSLIIPITFPIIWGTDQLVSLFVPFQDLSYTICFYMTTNFSIELVYNQYCKGSAALATFIFSLIVYCYRIIQCLRVGLCNRSYWKQNQLYNSGKYLLALITSVLSFYWKTSNSSNILPVWIVFATLTTIVSFIWDVKNDWALLNFNQSNFLLRERLCYPKFVYYISMIIDLIFRCTWVFYISPNITKNLLGSVQLFILIFGMLQIIRRCIWNLFRIEIQHIRNCQTLKALPKQYERLQSEINQFLQSNQDNQEIGKTTTVQQKLETDKQGMSGSSKYRQKLNEKEKEKQFKNLIKIKRQVQKQQQLYFEQESRQNKKIIQYLFQNLY